MSHTVEASPFGGGLPADAMDTETSCRPNPANYESRLTNEGDYASSVTNNNVETSLLNNVNCNNNNNNIVSSKLMNCSDMAEEKERGLAKAVADVTDEGKSKAADSETNLPLVRSTVAVLMCLNCNCNMPSASLFLQHVKEKHQQELNGKEEKLVADGANILIRFADGKHYINSINVDVAATNETESENSDINNKKPTISPPQLSVVQTSSNNSISNNSCMMGKEIRNNHVSNQLNQVATSQQHQLSLPQSYDSMDMSGSLYLSGVNASQSHFQSRNSSKKLKCPKCNWHYKYKETLEAHMKEKHMDETTDCVYCNAGSPHPRLARGESYTCGYKPYRCEVCNYSTTTKGNLSIHMQSDKHLHNVRTMQHRAASENLRKSASFVAAYHQSNNKADGSGFDDGTPSADKSLSLMTSGGLVVMDTNDGSASNNDSLGNGHSRKRKVTTKPTTVSSSNGNQIGNNSMQGSPILPSMAGNNPSWLQGAALNQVFQAMQNKTNLMQGIFAGQQARGEDGRPTEEMRIQMEALQQQLIQSQRQTAIVNQQLQQVLLAFHQQQQQIIKQHIPGSNNINPAAAIQQRGMGLMQPSHQHLSAIHQMQMMKNFTSNISNGFGLAHSGDTRIDAGSVKDLTARYVFSCHVCLSYGTDDIGALEAHVRKPRAFDTSYDPNRSEWVTRMRDDSFFCKLCKYSTMLKTNFNLHCKTEKHTNKINMINHVREGGPVSEWLIPYAINSNINPIATCNVCRFPANTLEKLKAHCQSDGHCTALGVCRLLDQMMKNSPRYNLSKGSELKYHCRVCDGFYTKFVIEVFRHLGEETHKMNQVQNKFNMLIGSNITDIISIEQVSSENRNNNESSQQAENSPNQENTMPKLVDNDQQQQLMLTNDNNNSQQEEKEKKASQSEQEKCTFGCDFETDTPKKMELHMITNHNCPLPVNKCPVCEETLPNSRALRLHVYERHDLTSYFPDNMTSTNDLVIDESVDMTQHEKNNTGSGEGASALKNLRRSCNNDDDEQERQNSDESMRTGADGFPNGDGSAMMPKEDVKSEMNKELAMTVNEQSSKSTSLPNLNNLLRTSNKLGNNKNVDEDSKRAGSCPPLRADTESSDEKQGGSSEGEVKDNRRRSNSLANEVNSDRADKSLVCSVCGEQFLIESALKNHFVLEHQSAMMKLGNDKTTTVTTTTESEVNSAAENAERSKNQSEASSQKTEDDSNGTSGVVDALSKLMDPNVQSILKACGLPVGANPMQSLNPNAAASINPFQQYQQQQQAIGLIYSLMMQNQYQNQINPSIGQNPFIMQTIQQQMLANSLLAQRDQQQNSMPGPQRPPFPNMPMFNPLNGGLPNMDHVGFGATSLGQASNTLAPDQTFQQQQQQQQHHLTMNNQPPPQPQQQQQQQGEVVRRPRTRISDDQLKILRENFDITTVPGEEQINSMVTQTGLPTKVIKHWFRNTLFKERQRSKDSPYNFNIPPKLTLEDAYNKNPSTSALSSTTSTTNSDSESIKVKQTNNSIQFPKQQKQPADAVMSQPETTVTISGTPGKSEELNMMTHSSPSTTASSSPKSVIKPGFNLDLIAHRNNDSAVNFCNENPGQYDLSSFLSDNNIPFDGSGMSPSVAGSSSLRRPARTRFSDYQLTILQNLFQKNPYPKDDDLEVLSRNLKLTQRVIVVWFQNARQKARKQLEQQQQQNPLPFSMQQQCTTPHQPPVRPKQPTGGIEGNEFNSSRQLPGGAASFDQPFSNSPKLDDDNNANRRSLSELNRSFMPGVDLKEAPSATAAAVLASASQNSDEVNSMQQPSMPNDANTTEYQRRLWAMFDHLSRFNFIQKPGGAAGDGSAGSEMIQERDRNLSDEDNTSNPMNMQLAMPPPRTTNPLKRTYNAMSATTPASSYGNQGVSGSQDFSSIIQNSKASNEDKNGMSQKESKRLRTTITSEQLKILYEYYNSDHSPSRKVIEQIAQEVDLKKRVVQVWFQNTRARQRKGQGRSGMANRFSGSTSNCRVCPHCRTMLRTQEEFEHHIRTIHGDKSSFGSGQLPPRDGCDSMNDKSGLNSNVEKSVIPSLVPKTEAISSFQFRREDFERSTNNFGGGSNNGSEFSRKTNNYNAASPLSLVKTYGRDRFENSPTLLNHMDLTTKTVSQQQQPSLPALPPPQKLLPPQQRNAADNFSDLSSSQNDNSSPQPMMSESNLSINLQNAAANETANSSFPGSMMNQASVVASGIAANFSPTSGQSINSLTSGGNSHTNNFVFPPTSTHSSLNDNFQGGEQSVGQKRHRTHLSMTQIRVMRHCFRDCRNPHLNECEIIAKVIGLDKRVVQVWFQNNRAKEKKKNVPGASFPGRGGDVLLPVDGIQVASKCGICEPEVFFSDVNHARSHLLSVVHLQQVKRMIDNGEDRDNSAFSHTGSSPCSSFDGTFGSDIGSPVDCGVSENNNQSPIHHSINNSSQSQQDFLNTSANINDESSMQQSPNHDGATNDRDEAASSGATIGNQSDAFAFMRQYGAAGGENAGGMQMSGNEGNAMRMQQAAWYTQVMQTISQIQSAKNHQQNNQ